MNLSHQKCEDCKFWIESIKTQGQGNCNLELPPMLRREYESTLCTADEGCDLGKPHS
jgi:hypothetical protein